MHSARRRAALSAFSGQCDAFGCAVPFKFAQQSFEANLPATAKMEYSVKHGFSIVPNIRCFISLGSNRFYSRLILLSKISDIMQVIYEAWYVDANDFACFPDAVLCQPSHGSCCPKTEGAVHSTSSFLQV